MSACEAPFRVKADRANGQRGRECLAGKEFLCAKVGIVGLANGGSGFDSTLPLSCAQTGSGAIAKTIKEIRIFTN